MNLINVEELDKKLWSKENLAKTGPSMWWFPFVSAHEPWRDRLRDKKSYLIRLFFVNCLYCVISVAISILLAIYSVTVIADKQFAYLWVVLVFIFSIWAMINNFSTLGKLFFYLFISKRRIEGYLAEEARTS